MHKSSFKYMKTNQNPNHIFKCQNLEIVFRMKYFRIKLLIGMIIAFSMSESLTQYKREIFQYKI